jgi:EAL domain-containing protein (putative c-di-GMP-specific phosphodiesterase class I)/GGDEF domain-containing protein
MNNIRNYLEVESEIHVQDTATSLGLSLSPHMTDEQDPILQTMMNAIFDMGYYKEMRLENVDGEDLVKLNNPVRMEGVPNWLIKLLPMKTAVAQSEISSGWNISGTLYVSSNPAYAYLKLYEQAKETLLYSSMLFVGAFILVLLVLRLTLQPLKAIEKQANEISSGNFTTIGSLPWTKEVRQVAKSMNGMSQKIGNTISNLNKRLDALNDSLKRDSLTKLLNQATFNVDIKRALAAGLSGYVLYLKFDDLGKITKKLGNIKVDKLLQDFSVVLSNAIADNGSAYRLYGSEFSLITHTDDVNSITPLAEKLKQDISNLGQEYDIDDMVHSGIVFFDKTSEFDRLMPALMEAYEQARIIGHNAYAIQQESISSMDELAWKEAVQDAITNNTPEITFTAEAHNYATTPPEQVMQEAFTAVKDKDGKVLSIGTFFSVAQEFDLAEALDKTIVNKILETIEQNKITSPVTINLSMASVASPSFQHWLQERLEETSLPNRQLAFSVTAYAAAKDIATFDAFSDFIESLGATVLLKRYSPDIIPVDMLHELHIDYIRLARDLTSDITSNTSKSDFIGLIQEVANLMEIKVLAESVTEDADFAIVKRAGLFGISR